MMSPLPTLDEFKNAVLNRPLEEVVQNYIFTGIPFVFHQQPQLLDMLREHLCNILPLVHENIIVIGSAKLGFSLNPDRFPRQFYEESDIDVAIVNEVFFDEIWFTMIKWHYPKRLVRPGGPEGRWLHDRKEDIFWGYFIPSGFEYGGLTFPEALVALRDVSTKWFDAFQSFSQYPEFVTRAISGRLYRTWNHAMLYHVDGLRKIRTFLLSSQQGESNHEL